MPASDSSANSMIAGTGFLIDRDEKFMALPPLSEDQEKIVDVGSEIYYHDTLVIFFVPF